MWSAYQRQPLAHLPTSATADARVLPISRVASLPERIGLVVEDVGGAPQQVGPLSPNVVVR